jgi:hypothetical protein
MALALDPFGRLTIPEIQWLHLAALQSLLLFPRACLQIQYWWLSNNEVAGLSDEMNTFDQLKLTKPLDLPT